MITQEEARVNTHGEFEQGPCNTTVTYVDGEIAGFTLSTTSREATRRRLMVATILAGITAVALAIIDLPNTFVYTTILVTALGSFASLAVTTELYQVDAVIDGIRDKYGYGISIHLK